MPIGGISSRLVANASLATLDRRISSDPDVLCYRRYVDDIVIVSRASGAPPAPQQVVERFFPTAPARDGVLRLDVHQLQRAGCEFELQKSKIRVHHLSGVEGLDFVSAIEEDFAQVVSERRSFVDPAVLIEDGASKLIRARQKQGTPIRVLRDADRVRLEHFTTSNTLRSLERVSQLVSAEEAREHCRRTLAKVSRLLAGDREWVENLDVAFRLLRLGVGSDDWRETRRLVRWMDSQWSSSTFYALRMASCFTAAVRFVALRHGGQCATTSMLEDPAIAGAVRRTRLATLPACGPEGSRRWARVGARRAAAAFGGAAGGS